ncbi:MAG: amidohydrolase family protein [Candidatus Sumerlaeota bacterium]|nr:amidohydrolase family protein [Candidatus Sumerlaeota bacterium]
MSDPFSGVLNPTKEKALSDPFPEILFPEIPLTDIHVHVQSPEPVGTITDGMDAGGCARLGLIGLSPSSGAMLNDCLRRYKKAHPDRFYLFPRLDYGQGFWEDPKGADTKALAARLSEQPARLKAQGFDGIKMIESKPTSRRRLPWGLDSDVYEPFFANAEKVGIPLLWHVGDPPQFWDANQIHEFARKKGWLYDKPTDPSLEQVRAEAENVLKRHPQLHVIFAHFYFLSTDFPRARAMFQRYPHVFFDTTPGAIMFIDFLPKIDEARDFFLEWGHRIVFGTDMHDVGFARGREAGGGRMHRWTRAYYGTSELMPREFPGGDRIPEGQFFRGMNLPKTALRKLFQETVERMMGKKPAPLPVAP